MKSMVQPWINFDFNLVGDEDNIDVDDTDYYDDDDDDDYDIDDVNDNNPQHLIPFLLSSTLGQL